jgi:hypothetical protein
MPWLPLTPDTILTPDSILGPDGYWGADVVGGYGNMPMEVSAQLELMEITGSIDPLGEDPTNTP